MTMSHFFHLLNIAVFDELAPLPTAHEFTQNITDNRKSTTTLLGIGCDSVIAAWI